MKLEEYWSPSEEDRKAVDILRSLGYTIGDAKTMVYFLNFDEGKSRDIERIMYASQPEVSVALSSLVKKNCLNCKNVKKGNSKGRPIKLYRLSKGRDYILDSVIKETDEKLKVKSYLLEEFKRVSTQIKNR